jgi:seryl-tRNA synthetase
VASFRAATAEQASFLDELFAAGLLTATDSPGVYGRNATFERVRTGFEAAVTRAAASDPDIEVLRFPPLLPRRQLEINGYLGSFPHLAGTVFSFEGSETQAGEQEAMAARHDDWSAFQSMTDVVLAPAACYAVYPEIARRGALPLRGVVVDTGSAWVFRNEPSDDPARMRSFHMREFVRIADPSDVAEFRNVWLDRTLRLFERLGLDVGSEIATDPFFGRAGRMLAANQRDQELKFEVLAQIGGPEPTAIASFNYHQDHFTLAYSLALEDGRPAHTGCAAFGIERVTLALFRAHGLEPETWPSAVRRELWP